MKRFRWNRKSYRRAHHLARLIGRFLDMPFSAPPIVERYWQLWERYPSLGDPLQLPLDYRYGRDDIPF